MGSHTPPSTLWIAALLVGAFLLISYSHRPSTDTRINSTQTEQLVLNGTLDLRGVTTTNAYGQRVTILPGPLVIDRDGRYLAIYGVGVSVAALPLYAVILPFDRSAPILEGAVGLVYSTLAIVLFFLLCTRLFEPAIAVLGTIAFGFGTTLWPVASLAFWQQAPVCAGITGGLLALASNHSRSALWAGIAFGATTFIRPATAILLVGALVGTRIWSRRAAGRFLVGATPFILATLVANRILWGGWLRSGYLGSDVTLGTPTWEGIQGTLFSSWRGLLVYSPFLILAPIGMICLARRVRTEIARTLVPLGVAASATLLLYASWSDWWGGLNQFGYRLQLEAVPVLVLLCMCAIHWIPRLRPAAIGLVVISCLTMAHGAAQSTFGFDAVPFPQRLADSPVGQAWIVAIHHPWPSIGRIAGVSVVAWGLWLLAGRHRAAPGFGPGSGRGRASQASPITPYNGNA